MTVQNGNVKMFLSKSSILICLTCYKSFKLGCLWPRIDIKKAMTMDELRLECFHGWVAAACKKPFVFVKLIMHNAFLILLFVFVGNLLVHIVVIFRSLLLHQSIGFFSFLARSDAPKHSAQKGLLAHKYYWHNLSSENVEWHDQSSLVVFRWDCIKSANPVSRSLRHNNTAISREKDNRDIVCLSDNDALLWYM